MSYPNNYTNCPGYTDTHIHLHEIQYIHIHIHIIYIYTYIYIYIRIHIIYNRNYILATEQLNNMSSGARLQSRSASGPRDPEDGAPGIAY